MSEQSSEQGEDESFSFPAEYRTEIHASEGGITIRQSDPCGDEDDIVVICSESRCKQIIVALTELSAKIEWPNSIQG